MLFYLAVLVVAAILYHSFGNKGQWPDGPRGIPFIGVLPDKKLKLYQQLSDLATKYGDFFSFNLGRSKIVVLSSPTAVNDLIVKKGQIYSSRTGASAQAKIIGQSRMVGMEYGDEFRVSLSNRVQKVPRSAHRDLQKHRKLIHSLLGMHNSKIFLPYQEYESRQTLKNLLEDPETFYSEGRSLCHQCHFQSLVSIALTSIPCHSHALAHLTSDLDPVSLVAML